MRFNLNIAVIFIFLLSFMICLSSVCASEDIADFNETSGNLLVSHGSDEIIFSDYSDNSFSVDETSYSGAIDKDNAGTFCDLNNDIQGLHSGDTYEVSKDYFFNKNDTVLYNYVIEINCSNVTINGNGHIIDAGGASEGFSIFKVNGDNVKIFDLTFINSQPKGDATFQDIDSHNDEKIIFDKKADYYQFVDSPVSWYGNNGLLCNCKFYENKAVNGGALSWIGNNGTIQNCQFINNTADCVGGAIYLTGVNNIINKALFINSTSKLSGESIFLDKHNNTKIINSTTNGYRLWTNNALYNIDINNLMKTHYSLVWDKQINLIPIIYQTIINGIITIPEDKLCCFCQYLDNGDFTLTIIRNFEEYDIQYQKEYLFTNTTINNIFTSALKDDFKNDILITKTMNVTFCINDLTFSFINRNQQTLKMENMYEYVSKSTVDDLIFNSSVMDLIAPDLSELLKKSIIFDIPKPDFFQGGSFQLPHNITPIISKDTLKFIDLKYALNVIFPENKVFKTNKKWNTDNGFDIGNIIGNGAKIQGTSMDRTEYKFIKPAKDQIYMISNLTIEGFNTAVENKEGYCIFNNVCFKNNSMEYYIDRDYGAAIFNLGVCICNNCHFESNRAKNGGAIFNQGYLVLDNCSFENNDAYGKGDNVCSANGGIVLLDGEQVNNTNYYVTCVKSISTGLKALISVFGMILSFSAGFLTTIAVANPVIGAVVGGVVGVMCGVGTSAMIIEASCDARLNRLTIVLSLTYSCVAAGVLGGIVGGYFCKSPTPFIPDRFAVDVGNPEIINFINDETIIQGAIRPEIPFEF